MRLRLLSLIVGIAVSITGVVPGQTASGVFITGEIGLAPAPDDFVGEAALGGMLGYRTGGGILFGLEYLWAGTDYYYFDDDRWLRAPGWSAVPAGTTARENWLFFRDRHVVGLSAGLSGSFWLVGVYATGGILLNLITMSEAAEFYPEFAAAATETAYGPATLIATGSARVGIVIPAEGAIAGTAAWMVGFDRPDTVGTPGYFRRNSLFFIGVTVQAGGL